MSVRSHSPFDRVRTEWRDIILTALTVIIVAHLFVVTPSALHPAPIFKVLNIALSIALAAGLLVLAHGWEAVALLLLLLGLFGLSYFVQGNCADDIMIVRIRGSAWFLMALAVAGHGFSISVMVVSARVELQEIGDMRSR